MAAAITDLLTSATVNSRPTPTTVASTRSAAATTLACLALTGWPTATAIHFITYKINTSGAKIAGSQCDWKGIVSGTNITTLTLKAGTDVGNAIGDVVELAPTAAWANDVVTWGTAEHGQTGIHALTASSTITSAKHITDISDTNGNEIFKLTPTASAINEFTVANAATGNGPTLSTTGGDPNVDFNIVTKGTGVLKVNTNPVNTGAWITWAPTFTNLSGGTLNYAKYKQLGKTIHFSFKYTLAGAGVAGSITFTTPTSITSDMTFAAEGIQGTVALFNTGSFDTTGIMKWASSTTISIQALDASFNYVRAQVLSSLIPHTWKNTDVIQVSGTYEAA